MGFEDEQDPSIKFRGFMNQEDEELLTLQRFSIVWNEDEERLWRNCYTLSLWSVFSMEKMLNKNSRSLKYGEDEDEHKKRTQILMLN